jgi:xanthine dehydrogenase accessory factor
VSEFEDVMRAAMRALESGEPVALATVVRSRGSTPRHAGARMIVFGDGRCVGTVGGATLEQRVIEDSLAALKDGQSRLNNYVFSTRDEDRSSSVGLCGGSVDVYIEKLNLDPTLMIIGAGHIALPLSRLARELEMRVCIVDDRSDYASKDRFPDAAQIHVVSYDEKTETLAPIPVTITPSTYVVVATWGWDAPALEQVLKQNPAYVGLVASKTKWRAISEMLKSRGISDEAISRVHAPVGLDLGAETPAEVALAIIAEILKIRKHSP